MKPEQYTILTGKAIDVSLHVNNALKIGWELYGSPLSDGNIVGQAMTLTAPDQDGDLSRAINALVRILNELESPASDPAKALYIAKAESESMKRLLRLMKATEAASMTEVIRNALRVYEATHGTPPTKTP